MAESSKGKNESLPLARADQADTSILGVPDDTLVNRDPNLVYHWKSDKDDHPSSVRNALHPRRLSSGEVMKPWMVVRESDEKAVPVRRFADTAQWGADNVVRDRDLVLCATTKEEFAKLERDEDKRATDIESILTNGQVQKYAGGLEGGGFTQTASLRDITTSGT